VPRSAILTKGSDAHERIQEALMKIESIARLAGELADLLQVHRVGDAEFASRPVSEELSTGSGRAFGGLLVAQALAAAQATVAKDRAVISLHCRFLRPGDESRSIHYHVTNDMDGGSFAHRRVVAEQGGKTILTSSMAFQRPETGLQHSPPMPVTDPPEMLWERIESRLRSREHVPFGLSHYVNVTLPVQAIPVDAELLDCTEPREDEFMVWVRFPASLTEGSNLHQVILAFASDLVPFRPVDRRHGLCPIRGEVMEASLDHAVWFHGAVRADEWMLFVGHSDWAGGGRGLGRANVFARDGRMVATISQEGMFRLPPPTT
jgi:acyl-CoA thioesterase-2